MLFPDFKGIVTKCPDFKGIVTNNKKSSNILLIKALNSK